MKKKIRFWKSCVTSALRDSVSFANNWWGLIGAPVLAFVAGGYQFVKSPSGTPTSAIIYGLAVFIVTAAAAVLFKALGIAADRYLNLKSRAFSLEKQMEPRLVLSELRNRQVPYLLHGTTEIFELCVKNSGCEDLGNCLVNVNSLRLKSGKEVQTAHLPMALRTARNNERDGNGPFNLRAGQHKYVLNSP